MCDTEEIRASTFYVDAFEPLRELTDSGTLVTKTGLSRFYHGNNPVHDCTTIQRQQTITGSTVTQAGSSQFYSKPSLDELNLNPPAVFKTQTKSRNHVRRAGTVKFPQMKEFAHFHYDKVNIGSIQTYIDTSHTVDADGLYEVIVCSNGKQWIVYRSIKDFGLLDTQIHYCVFDRKYSNLPKLSCIESSDAMQVTEVISEYLTRYSQLSGNLVNCGTVLNFFELNSKGDHLPSSMNESAINIPAIAAALVIKPYRAQDIDELDLKAGDLVSVIDMPPRSESLWWRGKKGLEVGFFPGDCVDVIDKSQRKSCGSLKRQPPLDPVISRSDKIKAFLRTFFLHRPPRLQLKQSGIVQERVFGSDLGEYLINSAVIVPPILTLCCEAIEYHGIVDGIYRLSGAATRVQLLRERFDLDLKVTFTDDDILDIHSIAAVLKNYFRELPIPLLTFQLYRPLIQALKIPIQRDRIRVIKSLIARLPPPHYRTAKSLFGHLNKLAAYSKRTGMNERNLAIVWSPNIMRYDDSLPLNGAAILNHITLQAAVTALLIAHYDSIFIDDSTNDCTYFGQKPSVLPLSSRLLTLSAAQHQLRLAQTPDPSAENNQFDVSARSRSMSAESFFSSSAFTYAYNANRNKGRLTSANASQYQDPCAVQLNQYFPYQSSTSTQQPVNDGAESIYDQVSPEYDVPCEVVLRHPKSLDETKSPYSRLDECRSNSPNTAQSLPGSPDSAEPDIPKSKNTTHNDNVYYNWVAVPSQAVNNSNNDEAGPTRRKHPEFSAPMPQPRKSRSQHIYVNTDIATARNDLSKQLSTPAQPSNSGMVISTSDQQSLSPQTLMISDLGESDCNKVLVANNEPEPLNFSSNGDQEPDLNNLELAAEATTHPVVCLAFSNPFSEDDAVRVPSTTDRWSADSD